MLSKLNFNFRQLCHDNIMTMDTSVHEAAQSDNMIIKGVAISAGSTYK